MAWTGLAARAAVVALALVLAAVGSARAADDLRPDKAEKTLRAMRYLCWTNSLCPLEAKDYGVFKQAAAGDRDAQYLWGLTLLTGDGAPTDREGGMQWIALAAQQGAADAAIFLANKEQNGEGVDTDEDKIAASLKKQADAGDVESMRALGPMLIRGRGVKQDPQAGIAMLRKAAEHDTDGAVARQIAELYLIGTNGLPHDHEEAMKWYAVSASHGDVRSMTTLSGLWENTPTVDMSELLKTGRLPKETFEPDIVQSYCWRMRAALLGDALGQYELALMLTQHNQDRRGHEIAPDLIQADYWFRLGARDREYDNSQIRGAIEPKLTTAQLNEARKLVAAWHKLDFGQLKATEIAIPGDTASSCPPMM